MMTTLNAIRAHSPCADGWAKLLRHLGKTQADDAPLSISTILDCNGIDDALWCLRAVEGHDREIRRYAVWCARQVLHLTSDPRAVAALDVAERHANGEATDAELAAARGAAASASAWAVAEASASAAAAAWAAAEASASAVWAASAWAAAAAAASASASAAAAAWAAAEAAARSAQAARLREVCAAVEERA